MSIVRHPRIWLWALRLAPFVVAAFWLLAVLESRAFSPRPVPNTLPALLILPTLLDDFGVLFLEASLIGTLLAHLFLTTVVLPVLLFQLRPFENATRWIYPLLGLFTLGIGTFLLHLLYVDSVLCRLAERKAHETGT